MIQYQTMAKTGMTGIIIATDIKMYYNVSLLLYFKYLSKIKNSKPSLSNRRAEVNYCYAMLFWVWFLSPFLTLKWLQQSYIVKFLSEKWSEQAAIMLNWATPNNEKSS